MIVGYKTYTCPVGRECGGCEWLSVPYEIQLRRKHEGLVALYEPFGVSVDPVIGMDEPVCYRAKIQSPFVRGRRGRPHFGMYERRSHNLIEARECLVEYPEGRRILETIANLAWDYHIAPYNEFTGRGLLRHAVIRVGHATGEVMVTLVVNRKEFPHKKAFVADLRDEHPEIATVVFNVNTRRTNAVLGPLSMTAYGQGWIEDEVCGCTFRIPSSAFYQTNPVQTEVLYDKAIELAHLGKDDVALDAYCGIGTIGIIAARRSGCALVGIESVHDAVEIAYENARINRVKNAEFIEGDAGEVLAKSEGAPSVVFMDPPRGGSSEQFLRCLLDAAPERIVYISCNPETQVRDLAVLADRYRIRRVVPVDMFPHTKHCETICLLTRRTFTPGATPPEHVK